MKDPASSEGSGGGSFLSASGGCFGLILAFLTQHPSLHLCYLMVFLPVCLSIYTAFSQGYQSLDEGSR